MSRIEKLIQRFLTVPKDLTWDELVKVLNYYGFHEYSKKGKTGGSRRRFVNKNNEVISLHKPHPSNVVKQYVIKQVIEKIGL